MAANRMHAVNKLHNGCGSILAASIDWAMV
jgi:hypothetical protein